LYIVVLSQVVSSLTAARQALSTSSKSSGYLLKEGFSYADIALAVALDPIKPMADTSSSGTNEKPPSALDIIPDLPVMQQLVKDFPEVFDWKDQVLEKQGKKL
jgi:glutathione S-transferase